MKLNYKKYGTQGEAIIILHGLLGSLDNWQTVAGVLSTNRTVYVLDARNHGRSPHSEIFTYDAMRDDVLEFMNENKISSASILGHSMGGKTAMLFALTYPDRTDRLIVTDKAPREYGNVHEKIFKALFALPLQKIQSRKEADEFLSKEIKDVDLRQFLLQKLGRDDNGKFFWRMNPDFIFKGYFNINKAIAGKNIFNKPTLFIKGGKSKYIREEDEKEIKKLFPSAIILTIADATHWVHADKPKEFILLVSDFLNNH